MRANYCGTSPCSCGDSSTRNTTRLWYKGSYMLLIDAHGCDCYILRSCPVGILFRYRYQTVWPTGPCKYEILNRFQSWTLAKRVLLLLTQLCPDGPRAQPPVNPARVDATPSLTHRELTKHGRGIPNKRPPSLPIIDRQSDPVPLLFTLSLNSTISLSRSPSTIFRVTDGHTPNTPQLTTINGDMACTVRN